MFTRKRLLAIPLSLLAALMLSISTVSPVSALPRDTLGHHGASCFYDGVEYSTGSIIKMANGSYYKCDDGEWKFHSSGRVSTGDWTILPYPMPGAQKATR